jgi:cytochrome c oxidase assembly factor CtaG
VPGAAAFLASLLVALPPRELLAHEGRPIEPHDLWSAWSWEPPVVAAMALAGWAYARGTRAVWRRAGVGRGVRRWQAGAFAGGLVALFVALISPLHALGEALFCAHMVQHLLLTLVAAPLLALGAPVVAFLWALPPAARRALARRWNRSTSWRGIGRSLTHPLTAWVVSALALWVWHLPFYYDAAVRLEAVHALEHVTFFLTALLFWWALVEPAGVFRRARGAALVYLFAAAMQSAILGALLTLAPRPWYTAHLDTTGAWGLSPLDDQQIAGGIMWVPANLVYLGALAVVLVTWLRDSERRVSRAERRPVDAGGWG